MKSSAEPPVFGAVRTKSGAGDSPVDSPVPFWITACVRLQPPRRRNGTEITASLANAVFPAVQALIVDRLRTEGDAAAPLNRDRIAQRSGLGNAKKAGWLFDYLELIGFMRVNRHYGAPGRGRAVDTFTVFTRPPQNYKGPLTHAELAHAEAELERMADHPERTPPSLFEGETAGQAEGAGSGTFRRDQGAGSGTLVDETAGHAEGAGSGTFRRDQGAGSGTLVDETAGHAEGDQFGTILQIDRSSISKEIEGSMEPVPGGTAEPPATGWDERRLAEVREVARALPFREWHAVHGKPDWMLTTYDTDRLQRAICAAVDRAGISLDQARAIGQAAVSEAKKTPVSYVLNAFGDKNLPTWLRRVVPEPAAKRPLPLLRLASTAARSKSDDLAPSHPAASPAVAAGQKCPGCDAEPDAPRLERQVERPDGRLGFCPVCCPPAAG